MNILSMPEDRQCLDSSQLRQLEQSFRQWVRDTPRWDVSLSRRRMLVIFLLIRYTGAKLNEVLAIDPFRDIDLDRQSVVFRDNAQGAGRDGREVPISEALSGELRSMLAEPDFKKFMRTNSAVDPGFVRRKFYERAEACGIAKEMGGPEMIRRSRAVELMQGNMPLPAVQVLLGHSTPNLTSSYVSFSQDEIRSAARHFMERESSRKTSARNSFYGKIQALQRGDIQTRVDLSTIEGQRVTTVITNDSAERLALREGTLVTAEVKAPWVILEKSEREPASTAENRFEGVVEGINKGRVNTEYIVRISEGTRLCSIVTTESSRRLAFAIGDRVWALFNSFAVVLHVD